MTFQTWNESYSGTPVSTWFLNNVPVMYCFIICLIHMLFANHFLWIGKPIQTLRKYNNRASCPALPPHFAMYDSTNGGGLFYLLTSIFIFIFKNSLQFRHCPTSLKPLYLWPVQTHKLGPKHGTCSHPCEDCSLNNVSLQWHKTQEH